VRQRGIIRLVVGTDYIGLTPGDRVLQSGPLTFDLALFQIWGALLNGARVVIADSRVLLAPDALGAMLAEHGITVVAIVTAVFHQLASRRPGLFGGVRELLFGGERLDPELARRVLEHGPPQRLIQVYGPTENTTFTTIQVIGDVPADAATVPIGRPIANTTCHILREDGTPADVGEKGEVVTGGDGVAAGYLNDPALTADRFVPDPFGGDPAARMYRTGDIAYWRPDGTIEFHGRRDGQFKIHGHRVEASEIEIALRGHPAVADAAVARQEMGPATGQARLVAHLVRADGRRRPGEAELRRLLGGTLPSHMIPAVFRWLDRLPLTPHGKVDRAALPLPADPPPASLASPASPVAAPTLLDRVRAVWQEALRERGVDQEIEPEHTLFDAGGTSLDVLRVHEQIIARWDLPDLTPLDLFTYPTLRGYSEHLASLLGATEAAAAPDRPPGRRSDGPPYPTP
jgi:acyl-coenzyme A synthetase/AMP-(fatty) acid ligase